ncbi:MAG: PilZ domain-containing protein [Deltaproteobacteria bacterium]|nr:PilZ domain-containing protein [Deltaproteobacteria bacterium]MBT8357610.1 PilZ domain-containing protein [Deltaproteobacteria bacterium]NNK84993.1 PilZ domain-containing protein [Desulfobacterales bacterium]NNL43712.1 PilZ domain-containing protein [Desulfobacterales bacterium]
MNKEKELRKEQRIPFESYIYYSTEHQLYEGEIKNYSTTGLFVKTSDKHSVGQTLNFILPYAIEKDAKRLGEVIWQNTEGIGVELSVVEKF